MMKNFTSKTVQTVFTVMTLIVLLSSCKKDLNNIEQTPSAGRMKLGEVKLDDNFNFSTYEGLTLTLKSEENTTYRVYGRYGSEEELLGTYHSTKALFNKAMSISAHYDKLYVEAHMLDRMKSYEFSMNTGGTIINHDFTGTFKTSTSVPTNVLYGVNSNRDFVVINTTDYAYDSLPQLTVGTIACAVDTFNNWVYYHSGGTMYKYDIVSKIHSIAYNNANPFGGGNFPRMEFDVTSQHLFLSNGSTSIKEVDPLTGSVVATYTIQGLVNSSGGGDLTFLPNGEKYLACFSGLYHLNFSTGGGIVQATRISAENMPYQLTSAGYDRQGFIYACTNDPQSMMLKLDPQDGSYVVVKTFPMKINDLGSVVSFGNSICTADSDGDGVCDELDDFPNDSTACCAQYTPSQLGSGSLAYEDLWPSMGDFDFNDLVVSYNYVEMMNTSNELVKIKAKFQVKAVGASFKNGFGFQIALNPNDIASVTGAQLKSGIVNTDGKGLEVGQTKPTIIVFENAADVINYVGGPFINTDPNQPLSIGQEIEIEITMTQPLPYTAKPENPFIFVNGVRSHEVHLADQEPTDLADQNLFGLAKDDSDPTSNRYYKDENNVPWGIDVSHNFRYPREKKRIDDGYNFMVNWAHSNGVSFKDWYKDNTGYRNENKLYMKHQ